MRLRFPIARTVVLAALTVAFAARSAAANTITVNTTQDGSSTTKCTLLDAVLASNLDQAVNGCTKGSGHDDIVISISTLPATFNMSNPLQIWGDVTIKGQGMKNTVLVSSNTSSLTDPRLGIGVDSCAYNPSAVYINTYPDASGNARTIAFQDLTLQPATGTSNGYVNNQGICLVAGSLNLTSARLTRFQARGIFAVNNSTFPISLMIDRSIVDHNHSPGNGAGAFVYILAQANAYNTDFEIVRSTFSNNAAEGGGGGVFLGEEDGGQNVIFIWKFSTFSGNSAIGNGGGILQEVLNTASYLEIFDSTIVNNHATNVGGGLYKQPESGSDLEIFGDILNNNTADADHQQDNLNFDSNPIQQGNRVSAANSVMFLCRYPCPGTSCQTFCPGWNVTWAMPVDIGGNTFTKSDALISALGGGGGANNRPVHGLRAGSPAIERGGSTTSDPSGDGRGYIIPVDSNLDGTIVRDTGAYELHPYQFETESMSVLTTSPAGVGHVKVTDGCASPNSQCWYSGGAGMNLQAAATGAFVTYSTPTSVQAGTYTVVARYKQAKNAAKFQVSVADSSTGTYTNIGAVQDGYAARDGWVDVTLSSSFAFTTTGQKFVKFAVTGRNSANTTGFQVFPDLIDFVKH